MSDPITVVVTIEGGVLQSAHASAPARIILFDFDTDGAGDDDPYLYIVEGGRVWRSEDAAAALEHLDPSLRDAIPHKAVSVGLCQTCGHRGGDCTGTR